MLFLMIMVKYKILLKIHLEMNMDKGFVRETNFNKKRIYKKEKGESHD